MKIFSSRSKHDSHAKKKTVDPKSDDQPLYNPYATVEDMDDLDDEDYYPEPKLPIKRIILALVIVAALGMGLWAMASAIIKPPQVAVQVPEAPVVSGQVGDVTTDPNDSTIDPDAPVAILGDRVSDYFTFLVAVTDIDGTRTDNLIVGSFDTRTADTAVNLMNIPRDTMSVCNRTGASRKINTAYSGGIDRTLSEVRNIVGFTPDRYVVLSFDGVAAIVDAIGGVEYDVPFRMKYDDPYQDLHIDLEPGVQMLTGDQAVDFLRWRKNNYEYRDQVPSEYDGSDESRIEKQQEFIMTLAEQVLHVRNTFNVNNIVKAVFDNMDTDFEMGEILWMATKCLNMSADDIHMMTLPGYADYAYAGTEDKYSFYFPSYYNTLDMVNEYLNPYENPITSINVYSEPPADEQIPDELPEEEELDDEDIGTLNPEDLPPAEDVIPPSTGTTQDPSDYTMDQYGFLMDANGNPIMNQDGTQMHISQIAPVQDPEAPTEDPNQGQTEEPEQPPEQPDPPQTEVPDDVPSDVPSDVPTDIPTDIPAYVPPADTTPTW